MHAKPLWHLFDLYAEEYDLQRRRQTTRARERGWAEFAVESHDVVLDVGCGTGQLSLLLAQRAKQVVGLDASLAMLWLARHYQAAAQVENIVYLLGDAHQPPLRDGTFDIVVSEYALHYMNPALALPALGKLVRPGGRLQLVDMVKQQYSRRRSSAFWNRYEVLRSAPFLARRFGWRGMVQVLRLRLGARRIHHLAHNFLATVEDMQRVCPRHLPGCTITVGQAGKQIILQWQAPN